MGLWADRRTERRRWGWWARHEQRAEARAVARANILADAERRPAPVVEPGTIVWRFDGRGWERWSDLWQAYEPGDVPETLPQQLARQGMTPAVGTRYRFDGAQWHELGPDDDERSLPAPSPAPSPAATRSAGDGPADRSAAADPSGAPSPPSAAPSPDAPAVPAPGGSGRTASDDLPGGGEPERPSTEEMLEAWRRRTREG